MGAVWILMETYDTGAGPKADRVVGIYTDKRMAFEVLQRRVTQFVRAAAGDPRAENARKNYGRLHWWHGASARFHCGLGAERDVYGMYIWESKTIDGVCGFCGHDAEDTIIGRDGWNACANCEAQ